MIATTAAAVADQIVAICKAAMTAACWMGLTALLLLGLPLGVLWFAHRRDPQRVEGTMLAATRLGWAPVRNAAVVLRRGASWCDSSRARCARLAAHGRARAWMPLICVLGTAVLVSITVFGWRTEQATLQLALDAGGGDSRVLASVKDWMTLVVFACGWAGGTLLLEALGLTQFLDRRPVPAADDTAPAIALPEPARPDHDQTAPRRSSRRSMPARVALAMTALVLLALPAYALGTAAAARADAIVEAPRVQLARRGAMCDTHNGTATPTQHAQGESRISEDRALSDCSRLATRRNLAHRWGLATAAGTVALDVALGWLAVLLVVWVLAALAGAGSLVFRAGAGLTRSFADTIDRTLGLVRALLRGREDLGDGQQPGPVPEHPAAPAIPLPDVDPGSPPAAPAESPPPAHHPDLPSPGEWGDGRDHGWSTPDAPAGPFDPFV